MIAIVGNSHRLHIVLIQHRPPAADLAVRSGRHAQRKAPLHIYSPDRHIRRHRKRKRIGGREAVAATLVYPLDKAVAVIRGCLRLYLCTEIVTPAAFNRPAVLG
ncbi:hypothetical protein Barb6_03357 [Bacteroidales bacterium Barb6]|nr:hypothetical protein Barb6_03357 [Bacteroidales bacterium Barb6]